MWISLSDTIPVEVAADLDTAARAAVRGGQAAMKHYRSAGLAIADKGVNDPVTEADHAANRAILEVLSESAPDDPILSEESPPPAEGVVRDSGHQRLWVVDPLDGTKEFIAQNGEFSVMVGLSISGRAAVGAVFQPDPGVLFLGWTGGGAWSVPVVLEGEDVRIESPAPLRLEPDSTGPVRLIRSRSHPDPLLAKLEARLPDSETVLCGSVGVKCARIAVDEADVYVHPVAFLKEWDTCAPEAVLRGAGGQVTDCAADPLTYGKADPRQPHGIFAARPGAWGSLRPMVREIAAPILGRES